MNILLFVKNMPYSGPAVRFGALIARLTGASITLLFASEKKDRAAAEATLDQTKEALAGIPVTTKIRREKPTKAILKEIQTGQYDMVVLKARRAIRLRKRIGGKIGREIARQSSIPVLIVKEDRPALKRVLICTGGLEYAEPAIELGARLAKTAKAHITVLHVTNPVPSMYTGLDGIEETLPELLQSQSRISQHLRNVARSLSDLEIDAQLELRHGDVTDEILREAEAGHYNLVVIGAAAPHQRLRNWILGNITQQVVNHIRCPVLIVRQPENS